MTVGLLFLLLCSTAFVAFGTAAAYVTEGPQARPLRVEPVLSPALLVFLTVIVVTALSQYLGHGRLWSTALNRVSYAVLIGGVLGLLSAVWMVSSETWRRRIVRIAGSVAANPGRAWTGATIVVVAFIAGAVARS